MHHAHCFLSVTGANNIPASEVTPVSRNQWKPKTQISSTAIKHPLCPSLVLLLKTGSSLVLSHQPKLNEEKDSMWKWNCKREIPRRGLFLEIHKNVPIGNQIIANLDTNTFIRYNLKISVRYQSPDGPKICHRFQDCWGWPHRVQNDPSQLLPRLA